MGVEGACPLAKRAKLFYEMELRFFQIPVANAEVFSDDLNRFLRGHRVLAVERELVREEGGAYWAVCVEFLPLVGGGAASQGGVAGKPKVDYKEVLGDADFAVFSRLRQLRKEAAERDGLPVYAVFTNEQMAAMVTGKVDSLAGMQKIEGVGGARIEKYGAAFLAVLQQTGVHETGGKPAA